MLLSVIITAHDEGLLLHKTLLSLKRALAHLKSIDYEVILHIDNGSASLDDYLGRNVAPLKMTVFRNKFGDSGESRNYGVKKASGKYVFFIDADDLISDNFFKESIKILEESEQDILIHPEACLTFENKGYKNVLWMMNNSSKIDRDIFVLFEKNLWINSVIGKREIFLRYPYPKTENGFGHEDYAFNIITIGAGIRHSIAPNTVFFYRQKSDSILRSNNAERRTQSYAEAFSIDSWKHYSNTEIYKHEDAIKNKYKRAYVKARSNKTLNAFITPVATVAKKITRVKLIKPPKVEDFVIDAWKKISTIETQLYPTKNAVRNVEFYVPRPDNKASVAYSIISNTIDKKPDYIFVVPWVSTGGADKVLVSYTKAIKELWPEKSVCVIATLPSENEWKDKLPDNVSFVDFGNLSENMGDAEKEILFTRLLIQLQCEKIHIINSEYAYRWVDEHKELVKANFKIYLSLFCYDIIPGTNGQGLFDYADPYALSIYDMVEKIYTDNSKIIKYLGDLNGFAKDKFVVHFQPSGYELVERTHKNGPTFNILWASRICTQKNPELLIKIADILNEKGYTDIKIDIYGKFDGGYSKKDFSNKANMEYEGGFNGLNSIDLSNYDCLLYTSHIDGLPNIILEAAACGIPIIASNAGGVGDFVKDKDTGLLVDEKDNVDAYIEKILYAKNHKRELKDYSKNAQMLLKKQHDWNGYLKNIAKTLEINK